MDRNKSVRVLIERSIPLVLLCAMVAALWLNIDTGGRSAAAPAPQVSPVAEASTPVPGSSMGGAWARRSLLMATPEEVGSYAVGHSVATGLVASGAPEVALVRSVTTADLSGLGLPPLNFSAQEPPLSLVILRGDFELAGHVPGTGSFDPSSWQHRVQYMAFVYDLNAGIPALTTWSPLGGSFRAALNDPNLPEDPRAPMSEVSEFRAAGARPLPIVPPGGTGPASFPYPTMPPLRYGAPAPPFLATPIPVPPELLVVPSLTPTAVSSTPQAVVPSLTGTATPVGVSAQ